MLEVVEALLEVTINHFLNFSILISKFLKLLLTLLLLFHYNVNGQYGYYTDVLKFSHYFNGGSARIEGIGGATSSLGGDIS